MFPRMKKINLMLRKCKSFSTHLGRSSSYSSLRSKSTRKEVWGDIKDDDDDETGGEVIFVGTSRKPYVISSKHLSHPVLNALIERSQQKPGGKISVKCEVVLFDHLLWMLENADPSDSMEDLAELYDY